MISVTVVIGIQTAKDVAERLKAIKETNDKNDYIVRQSFLFPAKDANKEPQKGYGMTIIFGKRIEGSADNTILLGRFHGLTSNNDDFWKSFLKEIIEIHLKVGKINLRL